MLNLYLIYLIASSVQLFLLFKIQTNKGAHKLSAFIALGELVKKQLSRIIMYTCNALLILGCKASFQMVDAHFIVKC